MGRFEDYNISESKMTIIVRTKEKEYSLELFHDRIDYCFDGIIFSPPVYIIDKGTDSMNQIIENLSALYPEEDMDVIRKSDLISVSFSDITEVFITEEIGEESEILSWLEDEYDLQGYALFNARKIEAHYCASTGVWKVQKYFLPKYYNENGEWMEKNPVM